MPQRWLGEVMEPSVSVPIAKPHKPAAVAEAEPGAGSARPLVEVPRIARLAAIPDVVVGERPDRGLAEQNRAGGAELLDDGRVTRGHAVAERLGAPARDDAGGVEQIFEAVGDAVQRAEMRPCASSRSAASASASASSGVATAKQNSSGFSASMRRR